MQNTIELDKASFVPLYYQLADLLREHILDNALKAGEAMPSEYDLMRQYQISRGTVREAMRILNHEGLIERRKGVGTFVNAPKIEHETGKVMGFSRVMQMSGKRPSAQVLEFRELKATAFLQEKLLMKSDEKVVLLKRLRFGDDEALLLEHSYFRMDVATRLKGEDLCSSVYGILREKHNYHLHRAENTIEAQLAEEEEAELLGIEIGEPVLILKRLVYFENEDVPFEYAEDIYRADRTKFKIKAHIN